MRNVYAIILGGGSGTRLWPLSTFDEPKQFLKFCSDKPMIEEALQKVTRLIKKENIFIATNKQHIHKIKEYSRRLNLPLKNLLLEPEGRNTLAPIAYLANKIHKRDPEAVIIALPCDHLIDNTNRFLNSLRNAVKIAQQGFIVTLGAVPSRPETGYGYIKIVSGLRSQVPGFYKVEKFIEKPTLLKARRFIKDRRYYWNCGIFVFRADVMLGELKRFLPRAYQTIGRMEKESGINKYWRKLPSISIDYAIMEKTGKAALVPATFGWMDLGSWLAVDSIVKKDKNKNFLKGRVFSLNCKNTLVWGNGRLVAALGLEDVIIVDTKDTVLVCSKRRAHDVKRLVSALKSKKK